MTSKGASVSRSEEQAFGSLLELGGSRVGHGGGGFTPVYPPSANPKNIFAQKLIKYQLI